MSIRKKHIIHHYTIVEVMVAMGIFLVMMTIMMQFFTSAQQVWNAASKRNMLYADARVAMNVMSRELQSMLYCNDDTDGTGIYPFWLEWTDIDEGLKTGEYRTQDLKDYFITNNDLFPHGSGTTNPYLTALNFISTTDLKSVDLGSDVCEVRYRFTPVYFTTNDPKSVNDVKGGKIERCCVAEYYNDNGTIKKTPSSMNLDAYNFALNPYTGSGSRVADIWPAVAEAIAPFETVITGVYSLRFTCYVWDDVNSKMITLEPMNRTSVGEKPAGGAITTPITYNLAMGTPAPVAIRIDMKLMDPKDLKELAIAINESNTKRIKILKQKMRTFSKVIYLGKREN